MYASIENVSMQIAQSELTKRASMSKFESSQINWDSINVNWSNVCITRTSIEMSKKKVDKATISSEFRNKCWSCAKHLFGLLVTIASLIWLTSVATHIYKGRSQLMKQSFDLIYCSKESRMIQTLLRFDFINVLIFHIYTYKHQLALTFTQRICSCANTFVLMIK